MAAVPTDAQRLETPGARPVPRALSTGAWMGLTLVALAIYGLFLRDHIPVAGGLGYDGETYGRVALQPEALFQLPLNRVQRCLPSLLVHVAIQLLHLPRTASTVVRSFLFLNTVLLLAGLWLWLRIVSHLGLRPPASIFGFCGIFLSFAGATMPYYYPVLTDTAALFLGLLVAWLYLRRSFWGLLVVLLLSGFVWPSLMYFMAPLVVWPADPRRRMRPPSSAWATRLALAMALLCTGMAAWSLPRGVLAEPIESVLPMSFLVLGLYAFAGGRELIRAGAGLWRERAVSLRGGVVTRAVAVVAVFAVHRAVLAVVFTRPAEPLQSPEGLLAWIFQSSVIAPGSFLVGHAANFGVLFIAVVGLWPRICRVASEYGPGLWAFLGAALAFSINAESRHSNALWPMIVVLVCIVLDRYRWPRWLLGAFCALSVLDSRAWVSFNAAFPDLYFANFPLMMGPYWYAVQAIAFTITAAYLHLAWRVAGARRAEGGIRWRT